MDFIYSHEISNEGGAIPSKCQVCMHTVFLHSTCRVSMFMQQTCCCSVQNEYNKYNILLVSQICSNNSTTSYKMLTIIIVMMHGLEIVFTLL